MMHGRTFEDVTLVTTIVRCNTHTHTQNSRPRHAPDGYKPKCVELQQLHRHRKRHHLGSSCPVARRRPTFDKRS
uniref:Uncharacterized protein n=1 Tax=Anopheles atroparvus TaxID=41427 RepID=A0AAG5DUY9_ANOAO